MQYPGSNWWAFDFHNHTPASSDYNVQEINLTPRDWLLSYMRKQIDCVVITDHNTGAWIDKLKDELNLMHSENPQHPDFRNLTLFPGVELTTSDGIHIIAIYDPIEGTAKIERLIGLAKYNNDRFNAQGICNEGASTICDHIHSTGGLVVIAHAEEINGLFHGVIEQSGTFSPKNSSRTVEQILNKADAIEIHDKSKPAYNHFRDKIEGRAVVNGSDAHRTQHVGRRNVWLKMTKPNLDGLKLAFLDPSTCITSESMLPQKPLFRILSLNVKQLQLRRQSLDIEFNPWFNAIIGGRGSGKSTLLETLRLVLSREDDLKELGDSKNSDVVRAFERFKGDDANGKGMVKADTELTAIVEKFDPSTNLIDTYQYCWNASGLSVKSKNTYGQWVDTNLSLQQASKNFPTKIFSQKQVFELAERPSALLTYIDSTDEVNYSEWKEQNRVISNALKELRQEEATLLTKISKKSQLETQLRETSRKVQVYQQSTVAQHFNTYQHNQKSQDLIQEFVTSLETPILNLRRNISNENPYENLNLAQIDLQHPQIEELKQDCLNLTEELASKFDSIKALLNEMEQLILSHKESDKFKAITFTINENIQDYRNQVELLRQQGINTAQDAERVSREKILIEQELLKIADAELELQHIRLSILKKFAELNVHRRALTNRRRIFVNSIITPDTNIRITISGQADIEQSEESFRNVLRLQNGTFQDVVLNTDEQTKKKYGLLERLVAKDIVNPTHKRVKDLKISILERDREILGVNLHGKFLTAINKLSFDDDNNILTWFPEDLVKIEFRRNSNDRYQSLDRASSGQKTSSILSFLLAHGNEPLLLDQPEDDLDNALISELVVSQIRRNKTKRQIIIVTHNPNLVVNGDAELVLPMEFINGQIQQNNAGGLQEREVREKICAIMEGGREAFRQRYKRILEDLD